MPIIPKTSLPYAEGTVPSYARQIGVSADFGMQNAKALQALGESINDAAGVVGKGLNLFASIKDSEDRMELLKLQQEQEHMQQQMADWQKDNPDSYMDYSGRYQEALGNLYKDQQERYDHLSRKNRERLDLWRDDTVFQFNRRTQRLQTQAQLTKSLNTGLGVVAEREDAGDFNGARIALAEVKEAGLMSNDVYEKRLAETNARSVQKDFSDIVSDKETNLEELRGKLEAQNADGTYSTLTWTDTTGTEINLSYDTRQNMVSAINAQMTQNARSARDEIMASSGDGSAVLEVLQNGSVSGTQRKTLENLVSRRRTAIAEARRKAAESATKKANIAAQKAHKLATERRQGAFCSEIYGTDFPSDMEARAEVVEDLSNKAALVYADDQKGYEGAIKQIQACAYPDAHDENAANLQYYRMNYYDEKAGIGPGMKEKDFYAYDPDDRWWKSSDKDAEWVVAANKASFDRYITAWINSTPGLTKKDIDEEVARQKAVMGKVTLDQVIDAANERTRIVAPAAKNSRKR